MNEKQRTKFGIKIDKMYKHQWSVGVCLSHSCGETYLYINLVKVSISIGFMDIE